MDEWKSSGNDHRCAGPANMRWRALLFDLWRRVAARCVSDMPKTLTYIKHVTPYT